ncbi:MAG: DUF3365 domain-containing protein [Xanthomonadales bacterium]|nr:DUF3365 domain-containing protein [Xanthomonadales bacterium]
MKYLAIAVSLLMAGSVVSAQDAANPEAANTAKAQAAIKDLGQSLRGALVAKMQSEGPVAAVNFCHDEAPLIASQVAERHQVQIGRTADRHRSPSNAPSEWQQSVLAGFAAKVAEGNPAAGITTARTVEVNGQARFRFAQSIPTEAPCLACHGDNVAAPIKAEIDKHYPNDSATGFKEGDLRGMFWVEFPMMSGAAPLSQNPPDARAPIVMSDAQRESLRHEMRGRMETLQGVTSALAAGDWVEVAKRAEVGTRGQHVGVEFRSALPQAWFAMARPMHGEFAAIQREAEGQKRVEVALQHLANAGQYCTSCHATFRPVTPSELAVAQQ